MSKCYRIVAACGSLLCLATPASAQWTVVDPSNLVQTTATARQLVELGARLTQMDRFRTPPPLPLPIFVPSRPEQLLRIAIPPGVYQMIASHTVRVNQVADLVVRTKAAIDNARRLDDALTRTVGDLERTVTTTTGTRSLTAVTDSIAASAVIGQRQAQANGAMLSALVEAEMLRSEREREQAIASLYWQATQAMPRAYVDPPSAKWRQP